MSRSVKVVAVLVFSLVIATSVDAQPRRWVMPPRIIDFTTPSPTVAALPGAQTAPYGAANAVFDGSGKLQFYIAGQSSSSLDVMDANGAVLGGLSGPNLSPQIAVVAVPGACDRYYVVHSRADSLIGVDLLYSIVDVRLKTVGPAVTLSHYNDNRVAFAVSRLRTNGSRFLYTVSGDVVDRYEVNASAISLSGTTLGGSGLATFPTQATLSSDGSKLAWSAELENAIVVADVDAAANLVNIRQFTGTAEGLEFSPDGKRLFISPRAFPTPGPLSYFDLAGSAATPTSLGSASTAYAGSLLQLAADGNVYATSAQNLGRIVNPDGPAPSFQAAVLTGIAPGMLGNSRTLPHAIDGEPQIASKCPCGNPSLVQSSFGKVGNFEVVAPHPGGGLAHYWRDNDDPKAPWYGPTLFGGDAGEVDAVSLILSDYGHLEVVARIGDRLAHFWRNTYSPSLTWHGPTFFASGASGRPSLIQGRFGFPGNFEAVTPLATGGLAHYYRQNPAGTWSGPAAFGGTVPVSDVALIQGNYGDNLEAVARSNDQLTHYYRSGAAWSTASNVFATGISGLPSLIQGRFGIPGNFEVVAPLASGGLAHFWRDNANAATWFGSGVFGSGAFSSAALIQSNYGNNLEVVARADDCRLVHYWRDFNFAWNQGSTLP